MAPSLLGPTLGATEKLNDFLDRQSVGGATLADAIRVPTLGVS